MDSLKALRRSEALGGSQDMRECRKCHNPKMRVTCTAHEPRRKVRLPLDNVLTSGVNQVPSRSASAVRLQ